MPRNLELPRFVGEEIYKQYLYETRLLTRMSVNNYVAWLNVVARILSRRLTANMVKKSAQIDRIASDLHDAGELSEGTIENCKVALRHYCRALNNAQPRRPPMMPKPGYINSSVIEGGSDFFKYLVRKKVGKNDTVKNASPRSYITKLNSAAKILNRDISAKLFTHRSEADLENVCERIRHEKKHAQYAKSTREDAISAMRHYFKFVMENR